jgi:hypothetical protein
MNIIAKKPLVFHLIFICNFISDLLSEKLKSKCLQTFLSSIKLKASSMLRNINENPAVWKIQKNFNQKNLGFQQKAKTFSYSLMVTEFVVYLYIYQI